MKTSVREWVYLKNTVAKVKDLDEYQKIIKSKMFQFPLKEEKKNDNSRR